MFTKLRKSLIVLILQILTAVWTGKASAQEVCANASDREQLECLSQKTDHTNQELQAVYQAALSQMPDNDTSDCRKSKNQLLKAQRAWQANCAYVGGAEGGSNLWITNFASRCELSAVQERTAFLRKETGLINTLPAASAPLVSAQQRILDILAAPIPADSSLPNLPSSYTQWTEDQQNNAPRQIAGRCGVLWTMMNSGDKVPLLPAAQDPSDASKLATSVCIAGKMPNDWPGRQAVLKEMDRILQPS